MVVVTQLAFEEFSPTKLEVPPSRPKSTKGFLVEFDLGRRMVQELGSYVEGFGNLMTQIRTPKSLEEVVAEIMKTNKATELFQTMAIMSLNTGNLTLEVNIMKKC